MAIPDTPLELSLDPDELTLDDVVLFDPEPAEPITTLIAFRSFLIRHSNWSRTDVGSITLTELEQVMEQTRVAVEGTAVPLANETEPETGPAAKTKPRRRPGSSSDKSPETTA